MYGGVVGEMRRSTIEWFRSQGYEDPLNGDDWKRYELYDILGDPDALLLFQDPPESVPHIPGYERERIDGIRSGLPGARGGRLVKRQW